ncbi:MAG: hypothetical protein ACSHW0_08685 [Thalassotalea sp.]
MARIYSSPAPSHIAQKVLPMLSENPEIKTWWNLRNDDIFVYRWGDPDYVKAFYQNLPMAVTEGIHMGSDGYVWAKTIADKVLDDDNYWEIDKHWYKFMIWGRLAYNLDLTTDFFKKKLKFKFPQVNNNNLYLAWQAASKIVPAVNRYQFQPGDRKFAVETSSSRETFRYVNDFQVARSMPQSGQLNAREYVQAFKAGQSLIEHTTPLQLADLLEENAQLALSLTNKIVSADPVEIKIKTQTNTKSQAELQRTLDDIRAFSYLGLYYAEKIRSATALEFYEKLAQTPLYKNQATTAINKALGYWQQYRKVSEKNYQPQLLARVNKLDWLALEQEVKYEQKIVARKLLTPFLLPTSHDPKAQLKISYQPTLTGEHRHQRLQIETPDNGNFMVEVFEHDGVFINNYHASGKGAMRWEWLQELPKGRSYYLNLTWQGLNRVIKVKS